MGDQALFAGTHFLASVYLARQLEPAGYGAFAIAQAMFWLFSACYGALVTEPLTVFGAGKHQSHFPAYLAVVIRVHWALVLPVAVACAVAALILGRTLGDLLEEAFLGLAVAAPLVLLAQMGRAASYVRLRPVWAVAGSACYFCVVLAGLWFLDARQWLSPGSAFLALGAGGLFAGLATLSGLRPSWMDRRLATEVLAVEHWRYGRWALATAAASWVPLNVYYLILPALGGLAAGAGLKAVSNLGQPAMHTTLALTALLLPVMVQRRLSGGWSAVMIAARRFLVVSSVITLSYLALLWLGRAVWFDLVYGGKYGEYAAALIWVGLTPVAAGVVVAGGSILRASERPDLVFRAYAAGAVFALVFGAWLTKSFGVTGAAAGVFCAYLVTGVSMLLSLASAREARATRFSVDKGFN